MIHFNKVSEVAKTVRKWAEVEALEQSFPENLSGMCAIAATKLFIELRDAKMQPEIAISPPFSKTIVSQCIFQGGRHAFVKLDNLVVDVTATQFRRQPVETHLLYDGSPPYWQIEFLFDDEFKFVDHLTKHGLAG